MMHMQRRVQSLLTAACFTDALGNLLPKRKRLLDTLHKGRDITLVASLGQG